MRITRFECKTAVTVLFLLVVSWHALLYAPLRRQSNDKNTTALLTAVHKSFHDGKILAIVNEEPRIGTSNRLGHSSSSSMMIRGDNGDTTASNNNKNCAPRQGLIVVNVLGLLANDLFQVAFSRLLSQQLCWPVVYREFWNAALPSSRGCTCLSEANLPQDPTLLPNTLSLQFQRELHLNASVWQHWSREEAFLHNDEYLAWVANHSHSVAHLKHMQFDFSGNGVKTFIETVKAPSSPIQVVSTEAFFIHYDWMKDYMPEIRQWLRISPTCCHHQPPEDAIVIHVRDFDPEDGGYNALKPSVYVDILNHIHSTSNTTTEQPLWIVCQPKSASSEFVQAISQAASGNVTIVTGIDQYDAFCTLTRAKTLVLSYVSTFSQMAALLNTHDDNVQVHYPLPTLKKPQVTLAVPGWRYHFVNGALDGIQEWDVRYERITPAMA